MEHSRRTLGFNDPGAHQKIAKMLSRLALLPVDTEQRPQFGENRININVFTVQPVHPLARKVRPQVPVVFANSLAGEGNFAQVGPGTAIGAAGYPDVDSVWFQPQWLCPALPEIGRAHV